MTRTFTLAEFSKLSNSELSKIWQEETEKKWNTMRKHGLDPAYHE